MGAAVAAVVVTLVTLLAGVGVLPSTAPSAAAVGGAGTGAQATLTSLTLPDTRRPTPTEVPAPEEQSVPAEQPADVALPPHSGSGTRVVFDISAQRVWLVGSGDRGDVVRRTYLVSGSLTDNLGPGTYEVYSRSRHAIGIDDSGTMEFFVRFTRGANAAIGFHSIPTKDGHLLQTRAELGTPQSHGCIRQARPDARRLWAFAPVGRTVVVTA